MLDTRNKIFRIVKIDESEFYDKETLDVCGRVWGVYIFDPENITYVAELRPSYLLEHLYSVTEVYIDDFCESEDYTGYFHVDLIDRLPYYECVIDNDTDIEEIKNYYKSNRVM